MELEQETIRPQGNSCLPENPYHDSDLPPEYCRYQDEGCEFANSCLSCPFTRCIYDEPGGKQHFIKRMRNQDILKLYTNGKGIEELASTFGVSQRTVQKALKRAKINEGLTPAQLNKHDIDRLRSYRELLDFYHGRHWESHARWDETHLTFNYAKVIIDKITSYLMSGVTLAVDPVSDEAIISYSFSWAEVDRLHDRLKRLEDRNISSITQAEQRAAAYLRHAEIEASSGAIRIPPNCGQQLYDVIDLSDARLGLDSEKRRALGLILVYSPLRGEYEARLLLGAV
jgi:hypothetical protein